MPTKRLIIRLSSLGDVILSTSALEVGANTPDRPVYDWVVSREYASLLRGHPAVGKLWEFDRSSGLEGWKKLSDELYSQNYAEIFDLHRTLRSRYLRLTFFIKGFRGRWRTVSKQRVRLYSYFMLKKLWPKAFRPRPLVERAAKCVGGSGQERPNLSHLVSSRAGALVGPSFRELEAKLSGRRYICVMPSSKWEGKNWPLERYIEALTDPRLRDVLPVILGTENDFPSRQLVELLRSSNRDCLSAIGHWSFTEVAKLLSRSWKYLGNDTGLAHLSEAVGVPSVVLFGPTIEDMGFGPWRSESQGVGISLVCRPCGKDGRFCYRFGDRYACLRDIPGKLAVDSLLGSSS